MAEYIPAIKIVSKGGVDTHVYYIDPDTHEETELKCVHKATWIAEGNQRPKVLLEFENVVLEAWASDVEKSIVYKILEAQVR